MTGIGERVRRLGRHGAVLTSVALWWSAGAVLALVLGSWLVGIPSYGEGGYWETVTQAVLLGVYAVAAAAARWSPMPSATVMTVMAFGIGALSGLTWPPWVGFLLSIGLWVPAGLHWQVWRRGRPRRSVAGLAAVLMTCLVVAGYAGNAIYDYVQGPQTPQSARGPYPDTGVRWLWSTAVTPSSFTVVARLEDGLTQARLRYGPSPEVDEGLATDWTAVDDETGGVRMGVDSLDPATTYHYAVETADGLDLSRRGTVRTFPDDEGPVTLAFASCQRPSSNAEVFETIRGLEPDLFLMIGDLHYSDIAENRVSLYVRAYDRQLTQGAVQSLYLDTPVAYMWDDHDYGPDDADRTDRSRPAALTSYRALGAHYPLALPGDDAPVAQAFSVRGVRVIMTDLRSARDPSGWPDGPDKSMLGDVQRAWFTDELVRSARTHDLVVWVSSVPWIVGPEAPGDSWGAYPTERAAIADVIAEAGVDNLVMVAGDAHMLAADDGTHSDYSSSGGAGFPVLQAAALDRAGSTKGGPYSQGVHPGGGQFGLLRVDPTTTTADAAGAPGTVSVRFEGRTWDGQVPVSLDAELATG